MSDTFLSLDDDERASGSASSGLGPSSSSSPPSASNSPYRPSTSHDTSVMEEDEADEVGELEVSSSSMDDLRSSSSARMRPSISSSSSGGLASSENIQVLCRFRPESKKELVEGPASSCVRFDDDDEARVSISLEGRNYDYNFDRVFQPHSSQEDVFVKVGLPTVKSVLDGYNAAVLSYGQTGSGKTYTMLGPGFDGRALGSDVSNGLENGSPQLDNTNQIVTGDPGLIPRIMQSLFHHLSLLESDETYFTMSAMYVEIYMENVRDLLNPLPETGRYAGKEKKSLEIQQDPQRGMLLPKATSVPIHNLSDVFGVLRIGSKHRKTAPTKANECSSRSHAILLITLQRVQSMTGATKTSQLYLCDLAGSEKVEKTEVAGLNLVEANQINKGLLSLGQVIQALVHGSQSKKNVHVPYRNSRLTRLLSCCIGGNSRTSLIINCSPHTYNLKETFSTLRFGNQMKKIQNKPTVNVEISVAELRAMFKESQAENDRLKGVVQQLQNEIKLLHEMNRVEYGRWQQSMQEQEKKLTAKFRQQQQQPQQPQEEDTKEHLIAKSNRSIRTQFSVESQQTVDSSSTSASSLSSPEPVSAASSDFSSSSSSAASSSSRATSAPIQPRNKPNEDDEKWASSDEDESETEEEFLRRELKTHLQQQQSTSVQSLSRTSRSSSYPKSRGSSHADDLRQLILHFLCPLTKKMMQDPVIALDGLTYERRAISAWLVNHTESPITGQKLNSKLLIPNVSLMQQIRTYFPEALNNRRDKNLPVGSSVNADFGKHMLSVSSNSFFEVDYMSCLPIDVIGFLCEQLDHRSLCRMNQVNKELYSLTNANRLWKLLSIKKGFSFDMQVVRENGNNFKAAFQIKYKLISSGSAKKRHVPRAEPHRRGVYLIPQGAAGASLNIKF